MSTGNDFDGGLPTPRRDRVMTADQQNELIETTDKVIGLRKLVASKRKAVQAANEDWAAADRKFQEAKHALKTLLKDFPAVPKIECRT